VEVEEKVKMVDNVDKDGVGVGIKGTVQRKPRGVKSSINCLLFLYCLAADNFNLYLKGHYSVKSIKLVSVFNDHKD
jgi:hypothetical protein